MIEDLRRSYATIDKIDPTQPAYTKLIGLLDKLGQPALRQIAEAKIKFISNLARNRILTEQLKLKTSANNNGLGLNSKHPLFKKFVKGVSEARFSEGDSVEVVFSGNNHLKNRTWFPYEFVRYEDRTFATVRNRTSRVPLLVKRTNVRPGK